MGILSGFAPWIVYWVLVGNVPFLAAVVATTDRSQIVRQRFFSRTL